MIKLLSSGWPLSFNSARYLRNTSVLRPLHLPFFLLLLLLLTTSGRPHLLFLEEAKHHVNEAKLKSSSVHPEESRKTVSEKEKRDKKSWKSSLISWWKSDKKSKLQGNPTNNSQAKVSGKRQGHVSGPIYNCSEGPNVKHWHPTSGPLTSLFKSTKREESEIPYMSLHQQNSPLAVQNYGP